MADEQLKLQSEEPSYWCGLWDVGATDWHRTQVDPLLKKHCPFMSEGKERDGLSVFVPLCGKTLDMVWLCQQGHTVVGCELSEIAALDFFKENSIPYETHSAGSLVVYEATDRNLKLIQGDIYECTSDNIGLFDCIWECNAIVAINPEDRQKYADKLVSLTKPGGRILMSTYEYDQSCHQGFPHTVSPEKVQELFKDCCTCEAADKVEMGTWFLSKFKLPWALRHMLYLKIK